MFYGLHNCEYFNCGKLASWFHSSSVNKDWIGTANFTLFRKHVVFIFKIWYTSTLTALISKSYNISNNFFYTIIQNIGIKILSVSLNFAGRKL